MYRKVSRFFSLDDGDSGKTKKRFHASEESASASKRPRYITELVREAAQEKKFACPYFQHSPQQYFHNRVCAGPGWRGIGDLKQHIYCSHKLPEYCFHCGIIYKNQKEQLSHNRTICTKIISLPPSESIGFNGHQEAALQRVHTTGGRDEHEQAWNQIYTILFPYDMGVRPSPYYDVPTRSSKLHPEQDSKTIVDSTYGSSSSSRQPSTEHSFSTPSNVPTTVSLPERYRQPPFPWRSIKDSKAVDFPPPQGEPDDLNPYPSFPHLGLDAPAVDHAYSKTFAGLDRRGMDNTFPTSDRMFQGYHTELIRRERSPEQLDHSERGTPNLNTMALALNENTQQRKKMTNEPLFQTTSRSLEKISAEGVRAVQFVTPSSGLTTGSPLPSTDSEDSSPLDTTFSYMSLEDLDDNEDDDAVAARIILGLKQTFLLKTLEGTIRRLTQQDSSPLVVYKGNELASSPSDDPSGRTSTAASSAASQSFSSSSNKRARGSDVSAAGTSNGPSQDGDDDDADGDEEDENLRKRKKLEKSTSGVQPLRLACPFYKRIPSSCSKHRACAGPGWTTVHRVKEHVYRDHALPSFCSRCYQVFEDEDDLRDHLTVDDDQRCAVLDKINRPQGYTKKQEKELRARKSVVGKSESELWNQMYMILFPGEESIPTPYYEPATQEEWKELVAFKDYTAENLPSRLIHRLYPSFLFESQDVQSYMTRAVEQAVSQEMEAVFRTYTRQTPDGNLDTQSIIGHLVPTDSAAGSFPERPDGTMLVVNTNREILDGALHVALPQLMLDSVQPPETMPEGWLAA